MMLMHHGQDFSFNSMVLYNYTLKTLPLSTFSPRIPGVPRIWPCLLGISLTLMKMVPVYCSQCTISKNIWTMNSCAYVEPNNSKNQ